MSRQYEPKTCPAVRSSGIVTQAQRQTQHQRNPLTPAEAEQQDTGSKGRCCKAPEQVPLQGHLANTFIVFGTGSEN